MSDDDLRADIELVSERFDFGGYEARAYPAILRHGELTASQLADRTEIPQPRVYDTVRSLAEKGLVELHETRPLRVLAIDPREAFEDHQVSVETLVDRLVDQYTAPERGMEAVVLIKSRATILRYVADVIDAAEYELMLSLTPGLLERYEEELRAKLAAGTTVELLLSPASEVRSPEEFDYLDLATTVRARRGITTPVMAVAAGSYSVYATREAITGDQDRYGVIFNRSELGFLVSGFLNTVLWTTAEPLIGDGWTENLPRRYATIRRCVADLHDREGPFYATISGRDILSGERREVTGRIVEASFGRSRSTATLTLQTDDGRVKIGGQVAALEDVEAHEICVGTDEPPAL